jgi:succinyl-CoA synthetase beta subunit
MDLLEYQGKQLFRKHGVPSPEGRPAAMDVQLAGRGQTLPPGGTS